MKKNSLFAAVWLGVFGNVGFADDSTTVYKSTDNAGVTRFSDKPIPGATGEKSLEINIKPENRMPAQPALPTRDEKASSARQKYQQQREQLVSQINVLNDQLTQAEKIYDTAQQQLNQQMSLFRSGYDFRHYRREFDLAGYQQNVIIAKREVFRLQRLVSDKRSALRVLEQENLQ